MITYISGGTRSGKSSYAQQLALQLSANPVYVATAEVWDDEFKQRIKLHKQDRGREWITYETKQNIHRLPIGDKVAVIDCVTLWLTNIFTDCDSDVAKSLQVFKQDIDELSKMSGHYIIISNELGMGLHADTKIGRKFTDLQGWANQYVADRAAEAIFMVSGLPLWLKRNGKHVK